MRCSFSWFALVPSLVVLGSAARAQCPEWVPNFVTLAGGVNNPVMGQVVFDDGTGPELYLCGYFQHTAQDPADAASVSLARWDGSRFESLAGGDPNAAVFTLGVFDDGSGPALYAGGGFTSIGATSANHIARWNGASWSPLGAGLDLDVRALCVFDDGSGPALYAAGSFASSGGASMPHVARWNGSAWSSVGGGLSGDALALTVFDDGSGSKLFAAGTFANAGGNPAANVASWNGSSWSPLGGGTNDSVFALAVYDAGGGAALYAGGTFTSAGGNSAQHVARWNGSSWSTLRGGVDGDVHALASFDDGSGAKLVAGGSFNNAGGAPAHAVASWNGATWSSLSSAASGFVATLGTFDEGGGTKLFAGGAFTSIGGRNCGYIARFASGSWTPLGAGQPPSGSVFALAELDIGDGPKLFAGGSFTQVGTLDASGIARWNGTSWQALGAGVDGEVLALCAFDDGSGPSLVVAGHFVHAGGVLANGIARWNGSTWSAFGAGFSGAYVQSLAVYDDGSGAALYAGGSGVSVGGVSCVAKWNGSAWEVTGGPLSWFGGQATVSAMKVWNDGSGSALYVGGEFDKANGIVVNNIAKWNGTSFSPLGVGTNSSVDALEVFNDGNSAQLYVAGSLQNAGGLNTGNVARWNGTSWSSLSATPMMLAQAVLSLHAYDDGDGPALYMGSTQFHFGGGPFTNLVRWDGASWTALGLNGSDVETLASYDDGSGNGRNLYVGRFYSNPQPFYNPQFLSQRRTCPASITPFCYGDGGQIACPCANSGINGHGCDNSLSLGGAHLIASGSTTPDNVVTTTSNLAQTVLTTFLQGNTNLWPGVNFGDGVRCIGGTLKRLYTKAAVGGVVIAPAPGDPSITARSASLGYPIAPGSELYYQLRYRDPNPSFCPAPQGNTWNASNGVVIRW